ncbi:MAG TPA: hypothetical protein VKY57_07965 [Chitinispirillaceae bacterium]|nr:hypothetical protein [Chitinispirillaceae bacterium]
MSIAVVLMLLLSLHVVTWGEVTGVYGDDDRRYVECAEWDNVLTKTDYEILAKSVCLIVRYPTVSPRWTSPVGDPVDYPEGGYRL